MNPETGYNPQQIEAVIDDAYRHAEELPALQDEVEEAIEMIETLPYSVNESGTYTEEEMKESLDGLFKLENISAEIGPGYSLLTGINEKLEGIDSSIELSNEIRELEKRLNKQAYRPARRNGLMVNDSEIS